MLSERFQYPVQRYWLYVLVATDEQCGSGVWLPLAGPLIGQYGDDDSLRVQDDVV